MLLFRTGISIWYMYVPKVKGGPKGLGVVLTGLGDDLQPQPSRCIKALYLLAVPHCWEFRVASAFEKNLEGLLKIT